ncbi:MAG TPA: sulfotransferase [Acidimicrobiales bacterium]|nr:sulfotransferase [Acidimicrobiales bacterium]
MDTAPIFNAERLLEAARRETGLDDFGPDDFLEPLEVLTETYRRAPLNHRGVQAKESHLHRQLVTRLQVAEALRLDPTVTDRAIEAPIYIVGLARTGTTLLYELLDLCPATRALLHWEAVRPVPVPIPPGSEDPRLAAARQELADFDRSPMAAIHYIAAELPAEDYLLLHPSLRIVAGDEAVWEPYATWYEQADQRPAYRYLATLVRLLDAQRPADRWLMKSPAHLRNLDCLVGEFPDVRFVWTHRDPMAAIASLCSLFATAMAPIAPVDPLAIGAAATVGCCIQLERALEIRDQLGDDRFVDVSYDGLVAQPSQVAERVATELGLDLTAATVAAFDRYVADHPQHKHGAHRYDAADFGLDEVEIRDRLSPYLDRFMVGV